MNKNYFKTQFALIQKGIIETFSDRRFRIFILKFSGLLAFGFVIWLIRMSKIEPFASSADHSFVLRYFKNTLVFFTYLVLKILGENAYLDYNNTIVGIVSGRAVFIGIPCYGMKLMGIYTLFIIAFPGNNWLRLGFIFTGCIIIQLLNVIRLAGLVIIYTYYPQYFDFNHHVVFTVTVYFFVFLMWIFWARINKKRFLLQN